MEPLAVGGAMVTVAIGYVLFPLLAIAAIVLVAAALTLSTVQLVRSMRASPSRR